LTFVACALAIEGLPDTHVLTPFGVRPKNCVLELPSGSSVREHDEGLLVITPTSKYIHPVPAECHLDDPVGQYNEFKRTGRLQSEAFPLNGWLDYAGWYPPNSESNLDSFTSTYTVPGNPTTNGQQVLFYFIGMQDNAYTAVNIVQPVLTWGNGVPGWNLASWDCCPKNITVQSKTITGFGAGDQIKGTIQRIDSYDWLIDATIVKSGANTTLYSHVGSYLYNWADVTLEVYTVTSCNQFAVGPMTFSDLVLKDVQQDVLSPQWTFTRATDCSGKIAQTDATTMYIQHN